MRIRGSRLGLCLAGLLASSCFAVTDLNRFEQAEALQPTNFSNLKVTVRGLTSHVNERFEYRVVDASNVIQSRGLIIPLGGPAATFEVHGAVPKQNGPFRVDFFADHDLSGAYDPRPDTTLDHAWRLPLEDRMLDDRGTFVIVFDHNTSFTNLNTPVPPTEIGKPATVHMKALGAFMNRRVEVRIADASTRRVVAMYRVPQVTSTEYEVLVNGMMETGVTYSVEVYTDDGKSTPSSVQAYRFDSLCGEKGLEASFSGANPGETPGAAQVFDAELPPVL
jgi:hypothetical protein